MILVVPDEIFSFFHSFIWNLCWINLLGPSKVLEFSSVWTLKKQCIIFMLLPVITCWFVSYMRGSEVGSPRYRPYLTHGLLSLLAILEDFLAWIKKKHNILQWKVIMILVNWISVHVKKIFNLLSNFCYIVLLKFRFNHWHLKCKYMV